MAMKKVHIIGGGTISHVRTHLALTAPAYGATARILESLCREHSDKLDVELHLTRMANAGKGSLETNKDIEELTKKLVKDPATKIIFFNPAITDFEGAIVEEGSGTISGKYEPRLVSRAKGGHLMNLSASNKIITLLRKQRKDIFVVGFKATSGATEDEQYLKGLHLLKEASCNLVLANDVQTKTNMIITPEEARYHVTKDRDEALRNVVEMAYLRSHLTFTRSTVISGEPVPWSSKEVPHSLRAVVDYCIQHKAYKPFRGSTVGHFAVKVNDTTFLTSRRKTNFNDLSKIGLVKIKTNGPDTVLAYGSKPSVGGQSQRIIFKEHPEGDCIVHFHCPKKKGSKVPTVSQREYECGSHQCGQNTSNGLKQFGNLKAVYLEHHGPNIVFNRDTPAQEVITFIEENFSLEQKTGG